ncbi:hypothetical protein BDF20DRAFT_904224 [Mycotypha africana]|uniref:uncharacterized protein n=1 Tax=Mycotypha africana TaxID=64632 RepID=UPI00230056C0|nr:uncharacterized protein BDF20DRAFT_904224 [Mycotypha africana]KAI8991736.1 hypothetical protein BDF20DRAFT_904224 [Mycotypha africana]
MEESSDLKRQIKALEEQNAHLLERSHQVEDEYRKVLAFKTLMDSYKEQVQQLEIGNREIIKEKTKLEEELANMTDTCHYLQDERDRHMEQIQLLEEHIKELELGDGQTLDKIVADHRPKMETLRAYKEQLQKDYEAVVRERNALREDLSHIRNGIPDSLLNQTQTIMSFRARILDLEKESSLLKQNMFTLETSVSEGTRNVAKDKATLDRFEKEHAKLQDKTNRLEDMVKMQLHDINRMLVEANYLNGINDNRSHNESFEDRPGLSNKDLEIIKEQNASLQIHVLNLQEEINETQGTSKKVRDMVKLYGQLLQEMAARFSNLRSSDEPNGLSGRIPRTKEEEFELLKKQIHDVRQQSKIEQQLIVSAWYDLVKRADRDASSLIFRSAPSSWLGRQRKALDVHLRQRLC